MRVVKRKRDKQVKTDTFLIFKHIIFNFFFVLDFQLISQLNDFTIFSSTLQRNIII